MTENKKAKLDRIRGYLSLEIPADFVRELYKGKVKGIDCPCCRLNLKEATAMEVVEAVVILCEVDEDTLKEMCELSGVV